MTDKQTDKQKKPDRARILLMLLAAAGILCLLIGSLPKRETNETPAYTDVGFYTEYLEERIRALCVSVAGVEEAKVFLTIDGSSEYVYERGGADYLILSGADGEEAVLLCEIYPRVRGVAVVCTNGDDPVVRQTVTELLAAALDLSAHKIRVAGS